MWYESSVEEDHRLPAFIGGDPGSAGVTVFGIEQQALVRWMGCRRQGAAPEMFFVAIGRQENTFPYWDKRYGAHDFLYFTVAEATP
jgi:hypothetical protein